MRILHGNGFVPRIMLFFFLAVSCLGLCPLNVQFVFAERVVGVSQGQFLRYSQDVSVTGNDTALLNQTGFSEWHGFCSIIVIYVNNSQIEFIKDVYNASYSNYYIRDADVETGRGLADYLLGYEPFFVAANLTAGDFVVNPQDWGLSISINDTVLTNYLGSPRETNHIIIEKNGNATVNNVEVSCNNTYEYFLDKLTGVSVRLIFDFQYYRGNETDLLVTDVRCEFDLLSSDPAIPEFALNMLVTFFGIASLLFIAISTKKHHARAMVTHSSRFMSP